MASRNNPFAVLFEQEETDAPATAVKTARPVSAPRQPKKTAAAAETVSTSAAPSQASAQPQKPAKQQHSQNAQTSQKQGNGAPPSRRPRDSESTRPAQSREGQTSRAPRDAREQREPREPREPREDEGRQPRQRDSKHAARRPPAHGREFDRHSGTGKYDSKKKEVAGHSWGQAIEVPAHTSTAEALSVAENPEAGFPESKTTAADSSEPTAVSAPVLTLDAYLREQRSKQVIVRTKHQPTRKANDGVAISDYVPASENSETGQAQLLALLGVGEAKGSTDKQNSCAGCPKRKPAKTKRVVVDVPFATYRPPAPRTPRPRREFGDARGSAQQQTASA